MIKAMQKDAGRLFVIAMPIGNLEDLSIRASQTLREVSFIACEDTRKARRLLSEIGVPGKQLISLFDHNETAASRAVVAKLLAGEDGALISDAGTPLISDPGFELVRELAEHGIFAVPVPGPSAVAASLSICPIPCNEFHFLGFLPRRGRKREEVLLRISESPVACVFFETARRMMQMLTHLSDLGAGDLQFFVARELTKTHEEMMFGTVQQLHARLVGADPLRGEVVCISAKMRRAPKKEETLRWIQALLEELPPTAVARVVARATGQDRKQVYQLALKTAAGNG